MHKDDFPEDFFTAGLLWFLPAAHLQNRIFTSFEAAAAYHFAPPGLGTKGEVGRTRVNCKANSGEKIAFCGDDLNRLPQNYFLQWKVME